MSGVGAQTADLRLRLQSAWRWWTSEIAGLFPQRLRAALAGSQEAVFVDVLDGEFLVRLASGGRDAVVARIPRDGYAARALRLSIPAVTGWRRWLASPTILQLPANDALIRTLELPGGARANLDAILGHEVARQSPIDIADIYYDYRAAPVDGATLPVALRIVRREPVDALLEELAGADIAPAAIEFHGDRERADGGTFPVVAQAARQYRLQRRMVPVLSGVLLLLGALALGAVYWRGEMIAEDLAGQVAASRDGALEAARIERALDAKSRQYAALARQKQNPATVAVLAAVARLLPDDAWLVEFERNDHEVRLHGYSAHAASLIALFDSSPYFRDAKLRAPLVQGPRPGLQRFDISFDLRADAS